MKLADFRLLADENLHPEVVTYLRECGFDVPTVAELGLCGVADVDVMRAATLEQRVVVTHDGDFGYLAIAAGERFVGIVFIRPGHIDPHFTIRAIEQLLMADLELTEPFIIVLHRRGSRVRIRVRKMT